MPPASQPTKQGSAAMLEPTTDARDWQQDIVAQLRSLGKNQADTAVTLERINGRLDGIDQRLRSQESATATTPASRAAWSQAWAGWAALIVAALALLLAAGAHITIH